MIKYERDDRRQVNLKIESRYYEILAIDDCERYARRNRR